jgi:8-oxo-dGTP diphosphatase
MRPFSKNKPTSMSEPSKALKKKYGNRVRIRVSGILVTEDKILLINHKELNHENQFWTIPGGGQEKGESLLQTLEREFREEVGLVVEKASFSFLFEFLKQPLHAVELYFRVECHNHNFSLGQDPEYNILTEIRWFSWDDILALKKEHRPPFFSNFASLKDFVNQNPISPRDNAPSSKL